MEWINSLVTLLNSYSDILVASSNWATWILLYGVGWVLVWFIRERWKNGYRSDYVTIALAGASLDAFGWAMHRQYWWLWRLFRDNGSEYANFFVDHGWITLIFSIVIWLGATLMMSPVLSRLFGDRGWFSISVLSIIVIYILGVLVTIWT